MTSFGFGSSATTAGTSGGSFSFGAKPTTAGFGLFGASQAPATGLTFGSAPVSSTGLFGSALGSGLAATTAASAAKPLGGLTVGPTTTATVPVGLGGIDTPHKAGLTGAPATGKQDTKAAKDNQIPNEILQTIDNFKSFVKAQKSLSSDIARGSAKPLRKVTEDTDALRQLLSGISAGLQRNKALADRLKADTAQSLHNAEIAQRTHDTPPGLQYDNTAPLEYFTALVAGFERDMQVFREEINNTERHLQVLAQPSLLTPQELALALRRLHDSFVALAGRLQTVHTAVHTQKEQYLNLRKYFLKDASDVFDEMKKSSQPSAKVAPGPTPFSALAGQHGFGMLMTELGEHRTGGTSSLGFGSALGSQHSHSATSFPTAAEGGGFQLQKPPVGNKRGKR